MTDTTTRPDCRCGHSHDAHQHHRRGTDCAFTARSIPSSDTTRQAIIAWSQGCKCRRYRRPSTLGRLWQRLAVAAAVVLMLGGTVAAAPSADAAGTRTVGYFYTDAGYGGKRISAVVGNAGDCDINGYTYEVRLGGDKNSISSVGKVALSRCNSVTIYKTTWAGTQGAICYQGGLGVNNLALYTCNNAVWGARFYYDARLPI